MFWWLGGTAFLAGWCLCVAGWVVSHVERRRFRKGLPTAGGAGPLLARRLIPRVTATARSLETGPVPRMHARWVSHDTLLFEAVEFDKRLGGTLSLLHWYGRARPVTEGTVVEARLSAGTVMFVLGWLAMAWTMAVLLFIADSIGISTVILGVAVVAARIYQTQWRQHREIAAGIVNEICAGLGHRDPFSPAFDANEREAPPPTSRDNEPGYLLGSLIIACLLIPQLLLARVPMDARDRSDEILVGCYLIFVGLLFLASYYWSHKTFVLRGFMWVCEHFSSPASRKMAFFYFALSQLFGWMAILGEFDR